MVEQYTKKEAQNKVVEKNTTEPQNYCPLIKGGCRKDCECFVPAYVRSNNKFGPDEKWTIQGFNCGNAMFSGEVYNTNQY